MKSMVFKGRVHKITNSEGKLVPNIDTDMIFHNKHLAITNIKEMGQHAFGNLDGWKDFPSKVKPGDMIVVGENFGCGSSRQQAVDCFISLGVTAIIGKSFGSIYYRNAVNGALPIIEANSIDVENIDSGDVVEVNFETGRMFNETKGLELNPAKPFSGVQTDIYQSGSIFEFAKKSKA